MGDGLALWPNAHQKRELAELLLQGAGTMAELAAGLGVSTNDAEHILARLRKNGLPVATLDVGDEDSLYRVLYPKGRVCAVEGCRTILRRSNPADTCELHGGGFLRLAERPPAARGSAARRREASRSRLARPTRAVGPLVA